MNEVKTPAAKVWELIEMLRHREGLRKKDLADAAGVSENTVCLDTECPERIPQGRLWIYLKTVGIKPCEVVKFMAQYGMKPYDEQD